MELTRDEAMEMLYGLKEVDAPFMGGHFNYKVSKNIELLERIEKKLDKEKAPSMEFLKASDKRRQLNEKFADKDENGECKKYVHKLPGGRGVEKYVIPGIDDPKSEYNKEMDAFNEKHKAIFEKREKQVEKFNNSLDNKEKVDIRMIVVTPSTIDDAIPKGLSRNAMNALSKMIEEQDDPEPKQEAGDK